MRLNFVQSIIENNICRAIQRIYIEQLMNDMGISLDLYILRYLVPILTITEEHESVSEGCH